MSRIASLGLHTPAALPYCITENILPDPPQPSSYTWSNGLPHEELLISDTAVIWSQGGVIRRVFRYDIEKEQVQHALLTWFPSDDPQDAVLTTSTDEEGDKNNSGYVSSGSEGNKRKSVDWGFGGGVAKKRMSNWNSKSRSYATQLGSFPKARAGFTSNAAAAGVEEDDGEPNAVQGKARALVVLLKTQAHIYFLSGTSYVIHLPFTVEHAMAAPQGLLLQRKQSEPSIPPYMGPFATGNIFTTRQPVTSSSDTPRLFSLTDPLAEVGLVVTSASNSPCTEDLVFISPYSELDSSSFSPEETGSKKPYSASNLPEVIFAVTRNPEKANVTVWYVRYIPQENLSNSQKRTASAAGTSTRRRSSFPATGTSTPVSGGAAASIASGSTLVGNPRDSIHPGDAVSLHSLDDFPSTNKRSNRRVSSLVARADLSGHHDRGGRFSDVSTSLSASFGPPPVPQNSMIVDSVGDQPVDELLNELNMDALGIGMGGLGIYDGKGLRSEVLMNRIESFPFKASPGSDSKKIRAFTLHAPSSIAAGAAVNNKGQGSPGRKVVLCIVNREEGCMLQLTFNIQIHGPVPKGYHAKKANVGGYVDIGMGYTPILLECQRKNNVLDAIKLEDHGISRILILTDEERLILYSPWGPSIRIVLPPTFSRWNPNVVGEDGSRRGSRKKGFARTLSTSPDRYERLEYSEPGGRVTVIDGDGVGHRVSITMAPREAAVKTCLETCRVIFGATSHPAVGEGLWALWIEVARWLHVQANPEAHLVPSTSASTGSVNEVDEWKAFVVSLFVLGIHSIPEPKPAPKRRSGGFARSASILAAKEWEELVSNEGEWGSAPEYLRSPAWSWMVEEEEEKLFSPPPPQTHSNRRSTSFSYPAPAQERKRNTFITSCIALARQFLNSPNGEGVEKELFGTKQSLEEVRRLGLAMALVSLNLIREEWKLDITMEPAGRRLCPVLRQIAGWLGWTEWVEKYMLEDVEMDGWMYDGSRLTIPGTPPPPFSPPSIYEWLIACMRGDTEKFMTLQDIASPESSTSGSYSTTTSSSRGRNPFSSRSGTASPPVQKPVFAKLTPRTKIITELYTTLCSPGVVDTDVVTRMVELGMTSTSLDLLPEGIAVPLREAVARCQEAPPTTWGVQALDLVGRKDLKMLIEPGHGRHDASGKWQSPPTHEAMRDVHSICSSTFDPEVVGSYDHLAENDRQLISSLLFKDDRRIIEATKLLQSNRPSMAKFVPSPIWNEQEALNAQRDLAHHVATRTLAMSPGRGLQNFSSRIPLVTEKYPVPGFNLSCIMKPSGTTVSADKTVFTEEKVCWAFFHSGVSAGVSVSREAKEIDTSWIVFNKPQDLTNRHAGFLLGLGLNGHLKNIAKWHAFNYLTPKHTMVSIGLLLGLSASYLGTMDQTITKLLSVHVIRLLPPGSAELNLSSLTQTAGIMGIGLLYANSQHRRMSEVMLTEIEYVDVQDSCVPVDNLRDEGYRLAAGFALGFINLGNGNDLHGLHDMHLVERLLTLAVGSKKVPIVHILDKAAAGATVALALIYMKTNDEALARKIDIPDTQHLFDYIRPDIFLLRTVAKNLIMWDNIEGSYEWIQRSLRPFLRERYRLREVDALDSEDLPFFNTIAGLCFCIGLKYAGSGERGVRDLLVAYLDQFIRICAIPVITHDQKLTRTTARNCQDLLALSAAMVMAGTGDIIVFRRLRKLHGRVDADIPYGSHLASHMAIGALFLGNGSHTFGTSNLAVASLLCAFYPLFPTQILDNKAHLQAFRHFWVLASEARCLVARDVDTHRPTSIPITITLKTGQEIRKVAPCLLPEFRLISTIATASPQHWSVVVDFENNESHLTAFQQRQSIFVHRRSAHAAGSTVFQSTLQAVDETEGLVGPLEWILSLRSFEGLDKSERALLLQTDSLVAGSGNGNAAGGGSGGAALRLEMESGLVDAKMLLEKEAIASGNKDRILGVKLLFTCVERMGLEKGLWVSGESVERLRAGVWTAFTGRE
ncbi:Anaphase-promoting complex subunit 1 [Rhizina undulata]